VCLKLLKSRPVCIRGQGPWSLGEEGDLQVLLVTGHTQGSCCLAYTPRNGGVRALFSGDHLAYSPRLGRLTGFPFYNW
jgi:glyoxylase-like metal-dependent hydrolase (beta-lactamase superfamily II)